jgi:hypothetical protein
MIKDIRGIEQPEVIEPRTERENREMLAEFDKLRHPEWCVTQPADLVDIELGEALKKLRKARK